MAITDWPTAERPREKLLTQGERALSDAELLAIFLRTGTKGKTAVDLARNLLTEFGGLRQLMAADQKQFCQADGLGPAKYALLQAVLEMGRRHAFATLGRDGVLTNPTEAHHFLQAQLKNYPYEVFGCLFLDNQHRVIIFEELFRGTINEAAVYPREVVRCCLRHNAAAVILAHNHPSGVAEPSRSDQQITGRLRSALDLINVRVLDHIVIGDGESISLADRGLM